MTLPVSTAPGIAGPQFDFTPPDEEEVEIRDFTIKKKRIKFKIDDDVFEATNILGVSTMQDLVNTASELQEMLKNKDFTGLEKLFSELLLPDSAKRFNERMRAKGDEAIDVRRQLLPIIHYLLERFGLRPTQPSLASPAGSPSEANGTSSTAGSSLTESDSPS